MAPPLLKELVDLGLLAPGGCLPSSLAGENLGQPYPPEAICRSSRQLLLEDEQANQPLLASMFIKGSCIQTAPIPRNWTTRTVIGNDFDRLFEQVPGVRVNPASMRWPWKCDTMEKRLANLCDQDHLLVFKLRIGADHASVRWLRWENRVPKVLNTTSDDFPPGKWLA